MVQKKNGKSWFPIHRGHDYQKALEAYSQAKGALKRGDLRLVHFSGRGMEVLAEVWTRS